MKINNNYPAINVNNISNFFNKKKKDNETNKENNKKKLNKKKEKLIIEDKLDINFKKR